MNRKYFKYYITICLINISFILQAQTFEKIYGGAETDAGYDVVLTSDGGYLAVGNSVSYSHGFSDVYILKLNSVGDTLWTKSIGGIGADFAYSVQQTSDLNYIIVGSTASKGGGGDDIYLIKIDNNGAVLWEKTFGGTGIDVATEVIQTSDGGYGIIGYTNSPGSSFYDMYFVKTNAEGVMTWSKRYGGVGFENGRSLKQTTDGGYVLFGQTSSIGIGQGDFYLIKTDVSGNVIWTKTYGSVGTDEGKYVQLTPDGGYILIGDIDIFGISDVYVVKTNSNGDTLWTKKYGGENKEVGKRIEPTLDNTGYIIAAITRSFGLVNPDAWLIKTDNNGNVIWSETYGGLNHEHAQSMRILSDGGFIVIGQANFIDANKEDIFLFKVNSNGKISTDAALLSLVSPTNGNCLNPSTKISVLVKNYGSSYLSVIPITVIMSGAINYTSRQIKKGTISRNESGLLQCNFTFNTFQSGPLNLKIFIDVENDFNKGNDTINTSISFAIPPDAPLVTHDSICGPGKLTLNAMADDSVFWFSSPVSTGILASGKKFTTPILNTSTTYYAQVGTDCPSQRTPANAIINPLPIFNLGNDTIIDSGSSIILDAGAKKLSYLWSNSSTNSTITINEGGTYYVKVADDNDCSVSDTIHVNILSSILNDFSIDKLSVYPNPGRNGKFNIEINIDNPSPKKIEIFDITGQKIIVKEMDLLRGNCHVPIDISDFHSGIYFLRVIDNGNSVTRKLLHY